MDQPGHCLCEKHKDEYAPRSILPAWYIAPEYLRTALFCGRCGNSGKAERGGLVFGSKSLENGLIQFANQACYWLLPEELDHKTLLRDSHGAAA